MAPRKNRRIEELDVDDLLKLSEQPRKRRKLRDEEESSLRSDAPGKDGVTGFEDDEDTSKESSDDDGTEGNGLNSESEDDVQAVNAMPAGHKQGAEPTRSLFSGRAKKIKILEKQNGVAMNVKTEQSKSFLELGASTTLVASLTKMSIRAPTEVQATCIPPLLAGRDCVGNAKTGSGKTIAFALPILQKLSIDPYGIFALVLTPTRELAFQISEQFAVLGAAFNIQTAVIVGGMDMIAQAIELNSRPHIVVATPGRIVDHLKSSSGEWNLSKVKFLVLDEADRLLTPTFAPELAYLFNIIPRDRQTCLFTATMTESIEALISAPPRPGKEKPFVHRMTASVETVETLEQYYLLVPSHVREPYLFHLLCNPPESTIHLWQAPPEPSKPSKKTKANKGRKAQPADDEATIEQPPPTIIFCARAHTAAYLTALLQQLGIRATALHARLTQRARLTALGLFRAHVVPVLVCTDVGARGLDVADVALVVNWDVPKAPEEYTHRVGRTARAGRNGAAVSFVTERDEASVLAIEERIKVKLTEMTMSEEKVLEKLNAVSTAKRVANMELHDSDFGKREEIHKIKAAKRQRVGALKEAQSKSTDADSVQA